MGKKEITTAKNIFAEINPVTEWNFSDIEEDLEYPGQIKVNMIRESRAVDFAK